MYPRSANKPAQAAAMVRQGLRLRPDLLALAAASHSGEVFHVAGVREILAGAGLDESALQNTPAWPMDEAAAQAWIRADGVPSAITADCSGKHAAMLATCRLHGWAIDTYTRVDHPLQAAIRGTIEELAGEPVTHVGVDGCGAPLFAVTLAGLTRQFRAMAQAAPDSPEGQVAMAIRSHPEYVSGSTRDEAALIRGVDGLIGKGGAEAVYAAALRDGRAVAVKIDDGGSRARAPVMAAALQRLGVTAPVVEELRTAPVLGGGRPVGEVRPVLTV